MERGAREFRLGKEILNEKWSKGMNKRRMCLKEDGKMWQWETLK